MQPSSKRMREDLSNQDGDKSDCLSLLEEGDGECWAWVPRVVLNGDGDQAAV